MNKDRTRSIFVGIIGVALLLIAIKIIWPIIVDGEDPPTNTPTPTPVVERLVEITFWTNDTKAEWIEEVTPAFNQSGYTIADGRPIVVQVERLSSGDVFPKIQAGEIQPTIWSPGETSWINSANVVWQDLTGRPLTSGPCTPIVYTTIGIGMWQPMAEAMGWPDTPIGWEDLVELAADPEGWARYGHPEWGQFKFGHTHPDSSNTGLLAMISFAYAAAGVTEGLTPEMVKSAAVQEAFRTLELNTYHYGTSSSSLSIKTAQRGPSYLSALTNSEIGVMATNYYQEDILQFPFAFIYPKEGGLWSDNPFCILDADWVSDEQREAARIYHDYLMSRVVQEIAIDEWLRPADPDIPLRPPISLDNGVDTRVTVDTVPVLESVSGDTVQAVLDLFHATKKRATVAIVLDRSESMAGEKMSRATQATNSFLEKYGQDKDDEIAVFVFGDEAALLKPSGRIGDVGESLGGKVELIFPEGNTALHDAVCDTVQFLDEREDQALEEGDPRLYGIILLSDGKDTNSSRSESDMFGCLPTGETAEGVKIFTIAYGSDADVELLTRIANRTNGRFFESDPENIQEILLRILYEQ